MTVTLGELYDLAHRQLAAAAGTALPGDDIVAQTISIRQLSALMHHLHRVHRLAGADREPSAGDLLTRLAGARGSLLVPLRWLPYVDEARVEETPGPLRDAVRTTRTMIDVVRGHRDGVGAPVTPYAEAFTAPSARAYISVRTAELAHEAGRVVSGLAESLPPGRLRVLLANSERALSAVLAQGAAVSDRADDAAAAFPQALPVTPVPCLPGEPLDQAVPRVLDDCERLSRVAYEALYGHDNSDSARRLGGGVMRHVAEIRAYGTLYAGHLLAQAAAVQTDEKTATALREGAGHLRRAARLWNAVRVSWQAIVDLEDPSGFPRPSQRAVRAGVAGPMPSVERHPAVKIARASADRIGRLLHGAEWTPRTPSSYPRPGTEILADAGGVAGLTQMIYRTAATDWQLTATMARTLPAIQHRLLCDQGRANYARYRYRTAPPELVEKIKVATLRVVTAQQALAQGMVAAALQTGMDCRRARLDAAAHRHITDRLRAAPPATSPAGTRAAVAAPGLARPRPVIPGVSRGVGL